MLASYLALTDASSVNTARNITSIYQQLSIFLRGYTIDASMTEIAKDAFDIGVQIIIDPSVKLNSYPSSFNLYINGVKECNIGHGAKFFYCRHSNTGFIVVLCLNMRYL